MIKEQHDTMKDQYIKKYNEEMIEGQVIKMQVEEALKKE